MIRQRKMGITITVFSLFLILLFIPGSTDSFSQDVFALKGKGVPISQYGSDTSGIVCGDKLCSEIDSEMKTVSPESIKSPIQEIPVQENSDDASELQMTIQTQESDGVGLEFSVPDMIIAKKIIPINGRVLDTENNANLSHTDWAFAVTNSEGVVIHKSTTLHGHFGVMNFQQSFPEPGTYTISYSTLSSGPEMLGKPIPELGQTRSVITGDLFRFAEDPTNNFGSRTFEFTVDVSEPVQTIVLQGSEPDAKYLVTLNTQPAKIITGEPVTLILDVDDYHTGLDATHVDALISIIPQHYYQSDSGVQPDAPIPLHGAYHGHPGLISLTQIFPKSGTVLLEVELSSIPYSVPLFGKASTQFVLQVFDSTGIKTPEKTMKSNVVDIVGLESPFYMPNTITASVGEVITFDNVDASYHTVTSVTSGTSDHDGKFDSGILKAGDSYELTLNESGTYDYFCSLHTGMKGIVIIS